MGIPRTRGLLKFFFLHSVFWREKDKFFHPITALDLTKTPTRPNIFWFTDAKFWRQKVLTDFRVCVRNHRHVHGGSSTGLALTKHFFGEIRILGIVLFPNRRHLFQLGLDRCACVASISMLLKIIGLYCKRALQKRPIFSKDTYNFTEPTNRRHFFQLGLDRCTCVQDQYTAIHCNPLQHCVYSCTCVQGICRCKGVCARVSMHVCVCMCACVCVCVCVQFARKPP